MKPVEFMYVLRVAWAEVAAEELYTLIEKVTVTALLATLVTETSELVQAELLLLPQIAPALLATCQRTSVSAHITFDGWQH